MNEIALTGCKATPLASYLKALGVLRLLAKECPQTRGAWRGNSLLLDTPWTRQKIEEFFGWGYQPTPVMAPWNGGSGFYAKDNKSGLKAIAASTTPRLALYRQCLDLAEQALCDVDRSSSPKGAAKAMLLGKLRGLLPDAALDWFDASVVLSRDAAHYPPLLGSGGNDGRLDFTNNFMQRLCDVVDLTDRGPSKESTVWLKMALYGEAAPGLIKKAIGQFSPGDIGGPNATIGFEADSVINPWDFVLMIEGALLFAAAVVRRNADDLEGILNYPFTVRAVGAGAGSLGEGDSASARGELWMPLWRRFASYSEVRSLLAEGRVALGRKPARDALDFVRAVHRLGGYRGIDSFQRYGLLMRSGKAFLATPLARVEVTGQARADWLDELDRMGWLARFRRFAQGDSVARRFLALRRKLEDALFDLAGRAPRPAEAQALLTLLGAIQKALANSGKAREYVSPIPRLSERWVQASDDGKPAFRIARALAGLGSAKPAFLPLRAQLFPVHAKSNSWMDAARKERGAPNDTFSRLRIYTESAGTLPDALIALLSRRLWLASQLELENKPLYSPAGVGLDEVLAFLSNDRMDLRISELLPGLSLCSIPQDIDHSAGGGSVVPAAFAMLRVCLLPDGTLRRLNLLGEQDRLPVPRGLLAQLKAGNTGNRAVRLAWRRLRASGLSPVFEADALPDLGGIDPVRAAAALLIPLRFGAIGSLARSVLKSDKPEAA